VSNFANILGELKDRWTRQGQYGFLFDNTEDTLSFSRFQTFNFAGWGDAPQVLEPLLFYVLHRASNEIHRSGHCLGCDRRGQPDRCRRWDDHDQWFTGLHDRRFVQRLAIGKMTKSEARDTLRTEIAKRTGQNLADRVLKDSSVTFEWFVHNRYFPLRKVDWRPETAKEKMAQIEIDLIGRFGEYPLDSFDRFMLQTHVNDLALRYSQDWVKQARSYLKSSFDEAIEQEFLVKDPTRKLAQRMGSVKDIQAHLRHARPDTTAYE